MRADAGIGTPSAQKTPKNTPKQRDKSAKNCD
jgi:hypothetical protein